MSVRSWAFRQLCFLMGWPNLHWVTDQVAVGGYNPPNVLRRAGVQASLDMRAECGAGAEMRRAGIAYKRIPVLDGHAPTRRQLAMAVRWLDAQVKAGKRVEVNCRAGRSRSALVAAAWLAKHEEMSPKKALHAIARARPYVYINAPQLKVLQEFCGR